MKKKPTLRQYILLVNTIFFVFHDEKNNYNYMAEDQMKCNFLS